MRRVLSIDTAAKDGPRCDYSVIMAFGFHAYEERWYLLDVLRKRLGYSELRDTVRRQRTRWRADKVLIEDSALGTPLLQELHKDAYKVYIGVRPVTSKLYRFIPQTDWIKSGQLVIPTDTPWFDDFRRELLAFPEVGHDDQVDALAQFAQYMRQAQGVYLETDVTTGRRIGKYRPSRPQPEDRTRF